MKKKSLVITFLILIIAICSLVIGSISSPPCSDDDNDGVCNDQDQCPNSLPREIIDKNGCDPFQFCSKFNCGSSCEKADFLNNEPNEEIPFDCITVMLIKEGQYKPICVPVECKKNPLLPNGKVQMIFSYHGNSSKYSTQILGISQNYTVISGIYPAWCVDEYNYIPQGVLFNATLYSSMDPDLAIKCPHCADPDWDKVNYIINHKQGSFEDIQAAIYYFIDGGHYPSNPYAIAMVEEAKLYGTGFWPQESQLIAVIVDVKGFGDNRVQLTIIEVDP
jgi:hypothetical protein